MDLKQCVYALSSINEELKIKVARLEQEREELIITNEEIAQQV